MSYICKSSKKTVFEAQIQQISIIHLKNARIVKNEVKIKNDEVF
jgi:hypothetical protein